MKTDIRRSILSRAALFIAAGGLALALNGCVGYTLGTTLPHDIRALHVPTFRNQTGEPMIETTLTDATIAQFQFDGSVRLVEESAADAVLHVVLHSYTLDPLTYERGRQSQAREYRARIVVSLRLVRTTTGAVVLDYPNLQAEADFPFAGDMSSSKRRVLPDLSRDLAKRIVDAVTQTW